MDENSSRGIMKISTNALRQLAALALLFPAAACDGNLTGTEPARLKEEPGSSAALASIELSPSFHVVRVGQSKALGVRGLSTDGREIAPPNVHWVAPDSAVVSVGSNGTTRANRMGVGTVIAVAGSIADTATVAALGPQSLLTTAFAGGNIDATARAGQTVSVPVVLDLSSVSSAGDLGSLQFDVRFNPALLQFQSAASAASGASAANEVEPGRVRFAFAASEVQGKDVVTLVTLTFKVPATAAVGAREAIGIEYRVPPTSTSFQKYEMPIAVGGTIQVIK